MDSSLTGNNTAPATAAATAQIITEKPLVTNGRKYLKTVLRAAAINITVSTPMLFRAGGIMIARNIP